VTNLNNSRFVTFGGTKDVYSAAGILFFGHVVTIVAFRANKRGIVTIFDTGEIVLKGWGYRYISKLLFGTSNGLDEEDNCNAMDGVSHGTEHL